MTPLGQIHSASLNMKDEDGKQPCESLLYPGKSQLQEVQGLIPPASPLRPSPPGLLSVGTYDVFLC